MPGRIRHRPRTCPEGGLIVRSYPIRVGGNSRPLTTELTWEEIERRSGLTGLADKEHTSKTNRLRRVGEPEWDLLRRAALHNAPTDIALTFADYLGAENAEAWRFEQLTEDTIRFVDEIERVTGARVSLIATGFMPHRGVIDRRMVTVPEKLTADYIAAALAAPVPHGRGGLMAVDSSVSAALNDRAARPLRDNGSERDAIEAARRPESVQIHHPVHGTAWIRDNKPINETVLRRHSSA